MFQQTLMDWENTNREVRKGGNKHKYFKWIEDKLKINFTCNLIAFWS